MNQFNKTFESIIKPLEEGFFADAGSSLGKNIGKVLDFGVKKTGNFIKNIASDIHKSGVEATGLGGVFSGEKDEDKKKKTENISLVENIIQNSQPKKTLKISVNNVNYNLTFNGVSVVAVTDTKAQADPATYQKIIEFLTKSDFSKLQFSNDYNLLIKTEEEKYINQKNENV